MPEDRYKRTHNLRKIRVGETSVRPYVGAGSRRAFPPTKDQLDYIKLLMKKLDDKGVGYEDVVKSGEYLRGYYDASMCIRKLIMLWKGTVARLDVRYIVLCENPETGERKEFSAKGMYQKPKGWNWIGLLRKEVIAVEE